MAKINLLPWREELRKERQKRFFVCLGIQHEGASQEPFV